jgi:S-formylglutathione hydrolase FrmB
MRAFPLRSGLVPGAASTAGSQLGRRGRLRAPVAVLVAAALLGLAGAPAVASSPARPVPAGRVEILQVPSGDADGRVREVWVYRPPAAERADLPVVYFLHGYPGGDRNAESIGLPSLLDRAFGGRHRPFVVAIPDGGSAIHPDTEWADSVDGQVRLEHFVTDTLARAVEGAHPRDRRHRAIAGFSMGGYGAMNIALRHPGLYGQVVSIAGYFHPDDPDRMGGGQAAWARANSPDRLVPNGRRTLVLLVDAARERDPLIKGEASRFAGLARHAGLHPTLVVAPGGHDWPMVGSQVPTVAHFLDRGWPRLRRP